MNVLDFIERYAEVHPRKIALKLNDESIDFQQMHGMIYTNIKKIKNLNIRADDKVILQYKNKLEWTVIFLSLLSMGCWVIPISDELNEEQIKEIMIFFNTDLIITENEISFEYNNNVFKSNLYKNRATEGGIYHKTSGSTGKPKFCKRSAKALLFEGFSYKNTYFISGDDKIFSLSPITHSYSLGAALMTMVVTGSTLFLIDDFRPKQAIHTIMDQNITILVLVPLLAKILAHTKTEEQCYGSNLKTVIVGAGGLTQDICERLKKRFLVNVMGNYGSTETGGLFIRRHNNPIGVLGKPMDGVKYKIIDKDGGEVQDNKEGELYVKCPGMMTEYYNENNCFDSDGFLPMGDIVNKDSNGHICLVGRKKSIIKIGGNTVNLSAIQKVITDLLEIKDCIVFSTQKCSGEEIVNAVVVSKVKMDESYIKKQCMSRLNIYHVPKVIKFISSIPRNEVGKVEFNKLLKL